MTDLQRFVDAQASTFDGALAELRAGRKNSHWMWWVFPQLAGLGSSPTARRYAIADADEGRAYAAHEVLGPRLVEAARAVLGAAAAGQRPEEVLGDVDAVKLRSSMTLFAAVAPDAGPWAEVLDAWYDGTPDDLTLRLLGR